MRMSAPGPLAGQVVRGPALSSCSRVWEDRPRRRSYEDTLGRTRVCALSMYHVAI